MKKNSNLQYEEKEYLCKERENSPFFHFLSYRSEPENTERKKRGHRTGSFWFVVKGIEIIEHYSIISRS
jgi:hypothetical protein